MPLARWCLVVLVALGGVGGCAGTDPIAEIKSFFERSEMEVRRLFQRDGKAQLEAGIKYYDRARYKDAAESLQDALHSGLDNADQVTAHKYLAFVHCVQGRNRQCRAHFRTALELDPSFDLQPPEMDHVSWGPVFRQAKARR